MLASVVLHESLVDPEQGVTLACSTHPSRSLHSHTHVGAYLDDLYGVGKEQVALWKDAFDVSCVNLHRCGKHGGVEAHMPEHDIHVALAQDFIRVGAREVLCRNGAAISKHSGRRIMNGCITCCRAASCAIHYLARANELHGQLPTAHPTTSSRCHAVL